MFLYVAIRGIGIFIYDSFGIETIGVVKNVVESHRNSNARDISNYYGEIEYTVQGNLYIKNRVYLGTTEMGSNNKFVGNEISLTYLPSYPGISILTPNSWDYLGIIIAFTISVLGLFFTSMRLKRIKSKSID